MIMNRKYYKKLFFFVLVKVVSDFIKFMVKEELKNYLWKMNDDFKFIKGVLLLRVFDSFWFLKKVVDV